ncbi:MAG: alkaline phosphatase, partial [Bacteroidales bacterium]|nr:alkaline phosphatase [Bacteroidales bacterium]
MKRRKFLQSGALATITASMATPSLVMGNTTNDKKVVGKAKNIIFLVSDGMSSGTLNMADLLMQRKFGKPGTWSQLYRDNLVRRALMDTASVGTLVTDSAAASSA